LAPRPSRRRDAALDHHPVDAGRIRRPQDRAEVVRILDAVEHHHERADSGAASTISRTLYSAAHATCATTP
jgi:hypothetical protein